MLALAFLAALGAAIPAQLGTNIVSPAEDSAVLQVACIMQQLEQPYNLLSLPWLRARHAWFKFKSKKGAAAPFIFSLFGLEIFIHYGVTQLTANSGFCT